MLLKHTCILILKQKNCRLECNNYNSILKRDKLNFRQDKHIFSPNVRRTSKKLNASIFFLDKDKLFGNRTSKNFDGLARRTSENF